MKLKQLASNMTELELNDGTKVLFSYETPVAAIRTIKEQIDTGTEDKFINKRQILKTSTNWSKTTSKHINKWIDHRDSISVDQSVLDDLVRG